jgi:hypothetical protein
VVPPLQLAERASLREVVVRSHHRRTRQLLVTGLVAVVALAVWPRAAEAQRRGRQHVTVRVGGGFWYPGAGYWGPNYQYPWRYSTYRYDPYYFGLGATSAVRLKVTPRDAAVFVDGYEAGAVDDFDGIFQRLRLRPGPHELTIYLDGYRTVRRAIYFMPGDDQTIAFTLEPLAAGETSEPPPPPSPPPAIPDPRDPAGRARPAPPAEPTAPQTPIVRFGSLAIAVQPADAEIYVDGERQTVTAGHSRVTIRLSVGRHEVEVRKEGFATFKESIAIARERVLTLNVSLSREVR